MLELCCDAVPLRALNLHVHCLCCSMPTESEQIANVSGKAYGVLSWLRTLRLH